MFVARSGAGDQVAGDELGVLVARPVDRRLRELVLAPGEVVVQRAERGLGGGEDLLDAGAGVALAAEQLGARLEDPVSCRPGVPVTEPEWSYR